MFVIEKHGCSRGAWASPHITPRRWVCSGARPAQTHDLRVVMTTRGGYFGAHVTRMTLLFFLHPASALFAYYFWEIDVVAWSWGTCSEYRAANISRVPAEPHLLRWSMPQTIDVTIGDSRSHMSRAVDVWSLRTRVRQRMLLAVRAGLSTPNPTFSKAEIGIEFWIYRFNDYRRLHVLGVH